MKLDPISLACRDMRHAWEMAGDTVLIEKQGQVKVFSRTLACLRCETRRIDVYRLAGHIVVRVKAHYVYPKGYHIKGGIKLEDIRYELFKNAKMVKADG